MSEPLDDPLVEDLDKLYDRFVAALERGPGVVAATPGNPAPEPEPGLNSETKPPDEVSRKPNPKPSRSASPPKTDKAAMRAALSAMFARDDVIELRAVHKGRKRTDAGYFDGEHRGALVNEAARINAAGAALYVTLNRIDPQLLARYCNRIEGNAKATATDKDVVRRRWLLTDFDPVRPTDTSATGVQVAAAQERAESCRQALKAEGWPQPLVCESGNGYHLLYPLDLPNDAESRDLIKGALAGLAARFDTEAVKVDQSVFNAERITKLYGTVANKGDHTPLTPWRLSRLVSGSCRNGTIVTADQLRALHPKGDGADAKAGSAWGREEFDLLAFLSRLDIPYEQDVHDGSERYKLEHCCFNPEHGRGEAAIGRRLDNGALWFKCQHSSCADKKWRDVRALVDGPREARASTAGAKTPAGAKPRSGNGVAPAGACDGEVVHRCLFDIEEKPYHWLWEGRIARGKVTMLAGHPDLGKSQVTASMAAVVTIGGAWPVDGTQCEKGKVIILSAEDVPEDTIRPRFRAAGADLKLVEILDAVREPNSDGTLVERPFNLTADIERLSWLAREIGDVALIVIDPITAYLGNIDSHRNAEVRAVLAPLAAMAAEIDAAVVCISHMTKVGGTEAMLRVMGSLGFVAAARAAYLVAKDPEDETRRLFLPMKNNLAKDRGGLAFWVKGKTLDGGIETSCVEWDAEPVTMTADEAMTAAGDPEERSELDEAADWLGKLLANGPVDSKEICSSAKQSGVAWRTVERAKARLRVKAVKATFSGAWRWELPDHSNPKNDSNPSHLGGLGGLGESESPEPSCGAGSTQGRQTPDVGGLGSNPSAQGRQTPGIGGLGSNPGGERVPGDREAEDRQDRQCAEDSAAPEPPGGQVEGDRPDQEPAAGEAEERETPWKTRL